VAKCPVYTNILPNSELVFSIAYDIDHIFVIFATNKKGNHVVNFKIEKSKQDDLLKK